MIIFNKWCILSA